MPPGEQHDKHNVYLSLQSEPNDDQYLKHKHSLEPNEATISES